MVGDIISIYNNNNNNEWYSLLSSNDSWIPRDSGTIIENTISSKDGKICFYKPITYK
jgi:hypothetical protein